ncbi:MAG: radical SAM protein [Chromatiaceae bacterium]|nr:radical SAM protein [Chromatiaceae bacterium]
MLDSSAFTYAFGDQGQLVYFSLNGQRLLFDGARGKLYRNLPEDLEDALDAMRLNETADRPGDNRWLARIAAWTHDQDALAAKVYVPEDEHVAAAFYVIYPTSACNLACGYCFNDQGTYGGDAKLMSMDTARKTLEFLKDSWRGSERHEVQVTLLGGEPLLNREVSEFLCRELLSLNDAAGYPAVNVTIDTNGTPLIDSPLLPLLARYGEQVLIEISIDGGQERHDRQRPLTSGKGSHAKVLEALRQVRAHNIPVRVVGVAPPPYQMVEMAEELIELGITDFYLNQMEAHQFGTGVQQDRHFHEWAEGYRRYAEWSAREKARGRDFTNDMDRNRARMLSILREPISAYSCRAGRSLLGISAHGEISPCDRFFHQKDYHVGDVEQGIQKIALHDFRGQIKQFGLPILNDDTCSRCYARWRCKGGCYARQTDRDGQIGEIDRKECRYIRHKFLVDLWYTAQDVPEVERG